MSRKCSVYNLTLRTIPGISHKHRTLIRNACTLFIYMISVLIILYIIIQLTLTNHEDIKTIPEQDKDQRDSIVKNTSRKRSIELTGRSSADSVFLLVDGNTVYRAASPQDRGIHLIVLNQYNGEMVESKVFDTMLQDNEKYLAKFINVSRENTILVFLVHDEASYSLKETGKKAIRSLGSRQIDQLRWRDMWAFVSKGKRAMAEEISHSHDGYLHAKATNIKIKVTLESKMKYWFGNSTAERRRSEFCFNYIGYYNSLCNHLNPDPIKFKHQYLRYSRLTTVPISILASNRPFYLYIMLRKLLATPGVRRELITVYIDGFYDQVVALLDVLDVKYVEHPPFCNGVCRINQSYKFTLHSTFESYPDAEYMLILEEDLLVADDIMDYFSQLLPVLAIDKSLYCISAWNDNSFDYSANDPAMVYRVEGMPGLGWILKRELFINELEPTWPNKDVTGDWDMYMRMPFVRKGRECLVPDISRTFHFGNVGWHTNNYVNEEENRFFQTMLNKKSGNIFDITKLTRNGYEENVTHLLKRAEVLDHSKNPCNDSAFIPDTRGHTYVMYITWAFKGDVETWLNVAKCFGLFYVDVRGFHRLMWRFWIKKNHIFVVGTTSPYIIYKPANITPISIPNSMVGNKRKYDMHLLQGYDI